GVALTILTIVQVSGGLATLTLRHLLNVSIVVFTITTVSVVALRRRLLANRFGARARGVVVIATATLVPHRLLAIHFGQPLPQVMAVDMLAIGGELLLAGLLLVRWFAGAAAAMFVGALVATFFPTWSVVAMVGSVLSVLAIGVLGSRND